MRTMHDYVIKYARNEPITSDDGDDQIEEGSTSAKRKYPLSKFFDQAPRVVKKNKFDFEMIRYSPEEVIEERHSKWPDPSAIEQCTKTDDEKEMVKMHIANFFYENGISFDVANSRSYEIMVESIGQFGPGLKPTTFHELRGPYLQKAKTEIEMLKEKQENAWKEYGCTLMCDGWTDRSNRCLMNFLANCPEGTFFLGSVDASSQYQDASMLADLLEQQIDKIGREKVVQIVTNNGANYKAAGRILEHRIPTLFWTPCAARCIDLMLEDIGKLKEFKSNIERARYVTKFIYRHGRLCDAVREKIGGRDLVRPGVTRFVTTFLTLQSLYKHKNALRMLFVGRDWSRSKLAYTEAGKRVCDIILSSRFWTILEDCIRASQPLLIVMRIVYANETPAMPELSVAMEYAKQKIKESFANKPMLLKNILNIVESRWEDQMEVKLYGAALFLNPSRYFDLKQNDLSYAAKQRGMFNDVLEKMVTDEDLQIKISDQVNDYEYMRGSFGKQMVIKQQKTKTPLDWWNAFGGSTFELLLLAKRIVGLCCSSSGYERNWSTFEFIHTKKRNRLEYQRLNDLVYIQYNRKIATRFQKRREQESNFNPLIIEEFQRDKWVDNDTVNPRDNLLWSHVDETIGASSNLQGRNLRTSRLRSNDGDDEGDSSRSSDGDVLTYSRRGKFTSASRLNDEEDEDKPFPDDDKDLDEDDGYNEVHFNDFILDDI